jgi:hypothetical protein
VCHDLREHLAKTLNGEPRQEELVSLPTRASNGPFAELLKAGILPGSAVIVSHHKAMDSHNKIPAA